MKLEELFRQYSKHNGFHNIIPISNIPSVIQHGILSNELAAQYAHKSVAMNEVQQRRDKVQIPNGLALHQYANLYFDARNPMMYLRQDEDICVLKVSDSILNLPDVILSDQNASSQYARFYEPAIGITKLNFSMIYATSWTDDDYICYWRKKGAKCAEVLVPNRVPYEYIVSAAVKNENDKNKLIELGYTKPVLIIPELFFK